MCQSHAGTGRSHVDPERETLVTLGVSSTRISRVASKEFLLQLTHCMHRIRKRWECMEETESDSLACRICRPRSSGHSTEGLSLEMSHASIRTPATIVNNRRCCTALASEVSLDGPRHDEMLHCASAKHVKERQATATSCTSRLVLICRRGGVHKWAAAGAYLTIPSAYSNHAESNSLARRSCSVLSNP